MPGRYIRKTTNATWTARQLQGAIDAVNDGQSIRTSAKKYKIPESSLRRRMKAKKLSKPSLGVHTTFTAEQEKLIVDHLTKLSEVFLGLTTLQCRQVAYDLAERMKLKHKFSRSEKMAGKQWFYSFLKRNPGFNIRKTEAVGTNRTQEFYRAELKKFFDNLQLLLAQYEFLPSRIYNVHETEIFTVQEKENSANSWERANRTTVTCAMNAIGSYVPPMFIFPFEDKMELLRINAPEGSLVECNPAGCSNEEMYLLWLQHFVDFVNPTSNDPVLLVLNSHIGHTGLRAYEYCQAHNIHIISLPPNMAYQMQPLYVTLFGPLKRIYYRECELYMKNNDLKQITIYKISDMFTKAFNQVATIDNGRKGFKMTGIWPVNPLIFNIKTNKNSNESNDSCEESNKSSDSSDDSNTNKDSSDNRSESSDSSDDSESIDSSDYSS